MFYLPTLAISLLAAMASEPEQPVDVQQVVKGILSRADALESGSIDYRVSFGDPGSKEITSSDRKLRFMDSDWLVETRGKGYKVIKINHYGKNLEIQHTDQAEGEIRTDVTIKYPQALLEKRGPVPHPPIFVGTFWAPRTAKYVEAHANAAKLVGTTKVGDVDTVVLEWTVTSVDLFKAFDTTYARVANSPRDSKLRVYVAPQFGYCLPRVEQIDENGKPALRFDANDFVKTDSGLFIPQKLSRQGFDEDGKPAFYIDYSLTKIRSINETLDASEFAVPIPKGALVTDQRPSQHIDFILFKALENSDALDPATNDP